MKNKLAEYLVSKFLLYWRNRVDAGKNSPFGRLERIAIEIFADWWTDNLRKAQPLEVAKRKATLQGWFEDGSLNTYHFESPVPLLVTRTTTKGKARSYLIVMEKTSRFDSDEFVWVKPTKPIEVD